MKDPIDLYVPCEVFSVQYIESVGRTLTPLERIVLEAVHLQIESFHDLAHLLQIGQRPLLDLLLDLWNRSYVHIDPQNGTLRLPKEVKQRIEKDRVARSAGKYPEKGEGLDGLAGTRTAKSLPLMMERLSGHILPLLAQQDRAASSRVVPPFLPVGEYVKASTAEMIDAVRFELAYREVPGQVGQVEEVFLAPLEPGPVSKAKERTRLLRIDADVREGDGGDLIFQIRPGRSVTAALRRDMETRLAQMAEAQPDHSFFKRMSELAAKDETNEKEELDEALTEFQQELERAGELAQQGAAKVETVQEYHAALSYAADSVRALVQLHHDARCRMQVLAPAAQEKWISAAIGRAARQLVICAPQIRYQRLATFLAAIIEALDRKVQVVLLWGTKRDEGLDAPVRTALSDLEHRHPGRFIWSPVSSRMNARLVIEDGTRLLVTSWDFLVTSPDAVFSLGLAADEVLPDRAESSAARLLHWVQRLFPDYQLGRRILTGTDFVVSTVEPDSAEASIPTREPGLPLGARPGPEDDVQEHLAHSTLPNEVVQLWQQDWIGYGSELRRTSEVLPAAARPIEDTGHRQWLWRLFRTSRRFIIIGSSLVTRDVVDANFLGLVKARLAKEPGLHMLLLVGSSIDPQLKSELDELRKHNPKQFMMHVDRLHLCFVANERAALLSSFKFLSNEGYYLPSTRRRQRSEIGVLAHDAGVVTGVVQALANEFPTLKGFLNRCVPEREADSVATHVKFIQPAVSIHLQTLLGGLLAAGKKSAAYVQVIEKWIDQYQTSDERPTDGRTPMSALWTDLDKFAHLVLYPHHAQQRIPLELVRQVIATAVEACWDVRGQPGVRRWIVWLAGELWREGRFHDAYALQSSLGEASEDGLPNPALVRLAASATASKALSAELSEWIDPDESSPTVRLGVTLIASHALLIQGVEEAWRWLTDVTGLLPSPWSDLVQAIVRYWEATYRPVPFNALGSISQASEALSMRDSALLRFREACNQAKGTGFLFPLGQHTWEQLYREGEDLELLRCAGNAADWRAASRVLANLRAHHWGSIELIDSATAVVLRRGNYGGDDRIEGPKRRACLQRINDVLSTAKQWTLYGEKAEDAAEASIMLPGIRELARQVRTLWPVIDQARKSGSAEHAILEPLLTPLLKSLELLLTTHLEAT